MIDLTVSEASDGIKRCCTCKEEKPHDDFYYRTSTRDKRQPSCKACSKKAHRRYKDANKAKYAEIYKRNDLWKKYKMTLEDFNARVEAQGGKCGNCTVVPSGKGYDVLCVDHDHGTDEIRGLLCQTCNRGIGFLGDTVESLERALAYLKRPR